MAKENALDKFLWAEKYRPRSLNNMVLNPTVRQALESYVADQNIPHLLFYGSAGSGKTTIAKILMDSIPCSTLVLNASGKDRSIETMRTEVTAFCRAMPPKGVRLKIVFLDEADGITPQAQESLKNTMETYSDTCRFILTANHVNRIIDPLRSRCTEWAFTTFDKAQARQMCESILRNEGIAYQNTEVATVVERCYPDIRHLMNTLQRCSIGGTFSMNKVESMTVSPEQIFDCIKTGKMKSLRQLVVGMSDFTYLYKAMFDNIEHLVPTGDQQGMAASQLCQHLFYDPTVPDREINFVTTCAEWSMILNVAPDFGK